MAHAVTGSMASTALSAGARAVEKAEYEETAAGAAEMATGLASVPATSGLECDDADLDGRQHLAGRVVDQNIGQGRNRSEGTEEKGSADDARPRVQGVAGHFPVQGADDGNVLQGVDDVDEVQKGEAVVAENLEPIVFVDVAGLRNIPVRRSRNRQRRLGVRAPLGRAFADCVHVRLFPFLRFCLRTLQNQCQNGFLFCNQLFARNARAKTGAKPGFIGKFYRCGRGF